MGVLGNFAGWSRWAAKDYQKPGKDSQQTFLGKSKGSKRLWWPPPEAAHSKHWMVCGHKARLFHMQCFFVMSDMKRNLLSDITKKCLRFSKITIWILITKKIECAQEWNARELNSYCFYKKIIAFKDQNQKSITIVKETFFFRQHFLINVKTGFR